MATSPRRNLGHGVPRDRPYSFSILKVSVHLLRSYSCITAWQAEILVHPSSLLLDLYIVRIIGLNPMITQIVMMPPYCGRLIRNHARGGLFSVAPSQTLILVWLLLCWIARAHIGCVVYVRLCLCIVCRFGLNLSILGRLGGASNPRTHRGPERFPGMTITYVTFSRGRPFVNAACLLCVVESKHSTIYPLSSKVTVFL